MVEEIRSIHIATHVRLDDWFIGSFRNQKSDEEFKAIGTIPADDLGGPFHRKELMLYGRWTEHPKYGRQYQIETVIPVRPRNRAGVVRYLKQAPHIGRRTARVLWNNFGERAIEIVRSQPAVAAAAVGGGFTASRAREAGAVLDAMAGLEECQIALLGLCEDFALSKRVIKSAVQLWGNRAADVVKRDPYKLMACKGCGFVVADRLYIGLGYSPTRLKRQVLALYHTLTTSGDGHTWVPFSAADKLLRDGIGGTNARTPKAVRLGQRAKRFATRRDANGTVWVAPMSYAESEHVVASFVAQAATSRPQWPVLSDASRLTPHQLDGLRAATASRCGLLVGSAGTGKTYSAARLILEVVRQIGSNHIQCLAPTNKAARRLGELMAGIGLNVLPKTIHSYLGVDSVEDGRFVFTHNAHNPVAHDFLIIDESSMVSVDLMADLLRACTPQTHILWVGDPGQLPPIAHGRPLHDMQEAGVATGELREIQRNSGMIVQGCAAIRDGHMPEFTDRVNPDDGRNLKLYTPSDDAICDIIARLTRRGFDPVDDMQVLVATNKSRVRLNLRLQGELNAGGKRVSGNPFRENDKVVCTKNGMLPMAETKGERFVANGQQGRVVGVESKRSFVNFDGVAETLTVPHGAKGDDDDPTARPGLQLAYAMTVHKAQGSEWPVAIVLCEPAMICDQSWFYTAISRAKQLGFVFGKPTDIERMIRKRNLDRRQTFLCEQIQKGQEL